MEPTRHQRVRDLFLRCCELEPPARERLLAAECAGEPSLRAEVEDLLAADRDAPAVLDSDVLALGLAGTDFDLDQDETEIPRSIGRYRILRRIGEGGMGTVYEAEQESPKRRVALKVISTRLASPQLRRRFENEAQILALLDHPGIAQIFEARVTGVDEGEQPYFAMEFVEGRTLTEHAGAKRLDTRSE
jgi:serine/threonine protein kinase